MLVVAALLSATACGDGGAGGGALHGAELRTAVLAGLADEVIVPGYARAVAEAQALVEVLDDVCPDPDPERTNALPDADGERAVVAWIAAGGSWRRTNAFRIGPAMALRTRQAIDFPVAADKVDELLAGPPVTADALSGLGADVQGFGAVEQLLVADGPVDGRRCAYAGAAAALVVDEVAEVHDAWTVTFDGGRPFRAQFAEPADDRGDAYDDTQAAIEDLVNQVLSSVELLATGPLARAAGTMDGEPDPLRADPGPAGRAVDDLAAELAGVVALWHGTPDGTPGGDETGIRALVADVAPDAAVGVDADLEALGTALAALRRPLTAAVAEDPAALDTAVTAAAALEASTGTDVVSALGITRFFSDNDGDS